LIEVFKLFKGFINVSYSRFFQLAEDSRTRGHTLKICKPRCKTDLRKYFFACKVINRWNSLPEAAIQAESVNSFKNYRGFTTQGWGFSWTSVWQPSRSLPWTGLQSGSRCDRTW